MCTLEKRGDDEHRLNPTLLDSIKIQLNQVRSDSDPGSCSLITAHGKFFSNGFDLTWAKSECSASDTVDRLLLMSRKLRSLILDLMSLPMPTIAAVTGHACAAGLIFTLCHDYILMRKDKGFLYMGEVDFGYPLASWFGAVIRAKVGALMARRDMLLRGVKLTGGVAAERGVIDSAHDSAEETIGAAVKLGAELGGSYGDGHMYAQIRTVVFADLMRAVRSEDDTEVAHVLSSRL